MFPASSRRRLRLIIGGRDMEAGAVSVRLHHGGPQGAKPKAEVIAKILKSIKDATGMNVKIIYYVEVISSWCHWAEPVWAELKRRYSQQVEFDWRIALLGADALPASAAQEDWFYRRSGTIVGSPYMLNSGWLETGLKEYLAPNCTALAARDFGITDDQVRLALAHAAVREGRKVGRWEESAAVAAAAGGLGEKQLLGRARMPETEKRARSTTAEFNALRVNQRPTFVLESDIGDRAVFSGFWRLDPLVAAIESMLADITAYKSWKAHFGDPPSE